ncbi:MAG: hypothetical protein KAX46_14560 [Chromatiaceae bacterium]|nr:hypothetical protein [Chromatiaceae bacterium]
MKSSLMDSQFRALDLAPAPQVPAGIQLHRATDWLLASSMMQLPAKGRPHFASFLRVKSAQKGLNYQTNPFQL